MQRVARIRDAGRNKGQRAIVLADGRRLLLDAEQVAALGVTSDSEIDERLLQHLAALDERTRAREAALTLLRYRLRSRAELIARLRRRGFGSHTITQVVADLTADGLVDDGRFARVWAESRLAAGRAGPRRVRAELRAKGVPQALIEETLRGIFSPQQEAELAGAVADRHLRRMGRLPPDVQLRRLAALLRRRGFTGAVIVPLLRRLVRESPAAGALPVEPPD